MKLKLILTFFSIIVFFACDKQVPFQSNEWKNSDGEYILTNQRLQMTEDLLNRELLINKNKTQIDSILGPPANKIDSNKNVRLYLVKEVYKLDIDPEELIFIQVHFNSHGISFNAELIKE